MFLLSNIEQPYNPLDKLNLAKSVVESLLNREPSSLPPSDFMGAGIYAIYYIGDFAPYRRIAEQNRDGAFNLPIYVGKAVPAGARKGKFTSTTSTSKALYGRLDDHTDSIRDATNLNLEDFWCRYLVVDDIWIPLGESLLIETFSPVWNVVVDGFGNHNPGSGRDKQKLSPWDVLHPGRPWAQQFKEVRKTEAEILTAIDAHLTAQQLGIHTEFDDDGEDT